MGEYLYENLLHVATSVLACMHVPYKIVCNCLQQVICLRLRAGLMCMSYWLFAVDFVALLALLPAPLALLALLKVFQHVRRLFCDMRLKALRLVNVYVVRVHDGGISVVVHMSSWLCTGCCFSKV